MKPLIHSLRRSVLIWVATALLFIIGVVFILNTSKAEGFDRLTQGMHSPVTDVFFTWFTYLGDGILILALALVLLWRKQKALGVGIIASYALSGLMAQVLKNLISMPRPAVYFRSLGLPFHEIPGVTLMKSMASFPSGHTASAFALMATLVLYRPASRWNLLWLLLATAIGYSRIFLGNHFPMDVLAGAAIGVAASFIVFIWLQRYPALRFD